LRPGPGNTLGVFFITPVIPANKRTVEMEAGATRGYGVSDPKMMASGGGSFDGAGQCGSHNRCQRAREEQHIRAVKGTADPW
jgi:hypothetical protein